MQLSLISALLEGAGAITSLLIASSPVSEVALWQHRSLLSTGNVTQLEEWTIQATASLISFFTFSLELLFVFTDAALSQKWHYHRGFSKLTTALNGAMEHLGTVAACCYFSASSFRQRLAPIWVIRLLPLLPGWWGVSTSELLHKCWWKGQLTVRCDVQRGVTLLISQWPSDVSAWSPVYGGFLYRQHPKGQKKKTVWWIKQMAKNI